MNGTCRSLPSTSGGVREGLTRPISAPDRVRYSHAEPRSARSPGRVISPHMTVKNGIRRFSPRQSGRQACSAGHAVSHVGDPGGVDDAHEVERRASPVCRTATSRRRAVLGLGGSRARPALRPAVPAALSPLRGASTLRPPWRVPWPPRRRRWHSGCWGLGRRRRPVLASDLQLRATG